MISHIHHLTLIVRDLDLAVERYEKVLGLSGFIYDSLNQRGVKTARVDVGGTWLVLVEPTDATGVPAEHLAHHGEGIFLLSFASDDFDHPFSELEKLGLEPSANANRTPRQGLDNWRVEDLPVSAFFGAQLQLTQEREASK